MLFPFLGIDLLNNTSDLLNLISIILTVALPILGAVVGFLKKFYHKKFYDALFSSLGTDDSKDKERYRLRHYVKHTFTRITKTSSSNSMSFRELIKTVKQTKLTVFIGSAGVGKSKLMQRLAFKFRGRILKGTKGDTLANHRIIYIKLTGKTIEEIVDEIRGIGNSSQVRYTVFLDGLDEMSELSNRSGDDVINELIKSLTVFLQFCKVFISLRPEILNEGYDFSTRSSVKNIATFKVNNFNEKQIKAMYRTEARIKKDSDKKAKPKERRENYKKLIEVIKNNHKSVFTFPLILTWANEILSDSDIAELKHISWYDALGKVIDEELKREYELYYYSIDKTLSDETREKFIEDGWKFLQGIAIKMTQANTQIVTKESLQEDKIYKGYIEEQGESSGNTFVARHLLICREGAERDGNQPCYEFIHNSIFWRVLAEVVLCPGTSQDLRAQIILNQSGKSTETLDYCRQGLWALHMNGNNIFPSYLNYSTYMIRVKDQSVDITKHNTFPMEIILSCFYGFKEVCFDFSIGFNSTRIKEFVDDRKLDLSNCENIGDMSLLKSFGSNSFDFLDCSNSGAVKAVIPDYVKKIDFGKCIYLTGVYITDLVAWCNIEMTISGTPFNYTNNLYLNDELVTDLVIPDGVTKINDHVFGTCLSIKSVSMPNSLVSIGFGTFGGCTALEQIHLPDSLISIGDRAFYKCTSLINLVIPDKVSEIGEQAFCGCTAIQALTLGKGVKKISNYAFSQLTNLIEINYNATKCCDMIGDCFKYGLSGLFSDFGKIIYSVFVSAGQCGNGITVNIGSNVERIPIGLFASRSLNNKIQIKIINVNFLKGSVCNYIGDSAFCNSKMLKSINIPDSVSIIESCAFNNSAIESIHISSKLEYISEFAFIGCSALVDITVSEENKNYKSIDGNLYTYDGKKLIQYAPGKRESVFNMPDEMEKIGSYAFRDCNSLKDINVTEMNSYFKAIDGNLYSKDGTKLIRYAVGKIEEEFVIPDGVTEIFYFAFSNVENLRCVNISRDVADISRYAFEQQCVIESINVVQENSYYMSIEGNLYNKDGTLLFRYAPGKIEEEFVVPKQVTKINKRAFSNAKNLIRVIIPQGVTIIMRETFDSCASLTNVTLPNSIVKIEGLAFIECENLKAINFNGTMQEWKNIDIGEYANLPDEIICNDGVINTKSD